MTSSPDYPLDDVLLLRTEEQVRAVGNLARFRILGVLAEQAATVSQLAERMGLLKGSVSYHLRVLAAAGLIRLVRTRTVRGGTERYWGRVARAFEVATDNPAYHDRSLLLRMVADDLAAADPDSGQLLNVVRVRLSDTHYRNLADGVAELVRQAHEWDDPAGAAVNLTVALFRSPEATPPKDHPA